MRKIRWVAILVIALICFTIPVSASVPYEGYNYDSWEDVVPSPTAYLPAEALSGSDLGVGDFDQPSDMCIADNGDVYIVDMNNNRIVVFDEKWHIKEEIISFMGDDGEEFFNLPGGIFVTREGDLYIADSENRRIVVLDDQRTLKLIIENPQSETLEEGFDFVPIKVGVDYAGRIYCISRGVFEGIMSFDEEGQFYGYLGTINVSISPADILWRKLSTKTQREKQILYIPTEFTGLDLDKDGFIYTTNVDNYSNETIKRLNPSGKDVLKKPSGARIVGDLNYSGFGLFSGPSRFVDITVRDKGLYTAIDSMRGRVFTYDHEGNLLYIFGGMGSQLGAFKKPIAIESIGEELLVLDQERGAIIRFEPSSYGSNINTAVGLRYDGDEEEAVDYWKEVLKEDTNFELAYVGIGKSLLTKGDNKGAMTYLKLGMDQKYYSIAYKRYRNEVLKASLGYFLSGGIVLLILAAVYKLLKGRKRRRQQSHA